MADGAECTNFNERYRRREERLGRHVKSEPWNSTGWGLPEPFRMVVCGNSGSGKTSWVVDFIESHTACRQIHLFSGCLGELLWRNFVEEREELEEDHGLDPGSLIQAYDDLDDLPDVRTYDPEGQTLIIIDDFVGWKGPGSQKLIDHFKQGRKHGCSYVYITQSWYMTPRFLRQNADTAVLFRQMEDDVMNCHQQLPTVGLSRQDIKALYKRSQTEIGPYGCLFLSANAGLPPNKCIRLGLKGFLAPPEQEERLGKSMDKA